MKKELNLGVLFTGKLDESFQRAINTIQSSLGKMEAKVQDVGKTQEKIAKETIIGYQKMGKGLQNYVKDVEYLLSVQARWYAAKALLFAAVEAPFQALKKGLEYVVQIDTATAKLNRYDALLGEVGASARKTTRDLLEFAQVLNLKYPIPFEDIMKAADRLRAAGVEIKTIRGVLESFVQFQTAWPDVEMDKFTKAVVGFIETYKKTPIFAQMTSEAEMYKAALDKLAVTAGIGVIEPKDFTVVLQHFNQMAQIVGLTADQMLALSVMVTQLGSKAGPAARALRGMFVSLGTADTLKYLEQITKQTGIIELHLDKTKTLGEQVITLFKGLRKLVGTGEEGVSLAAQKVLTKLFSAERIGPVLALIRSSEIYEEAIRKIIDAEEANRRASEEMTKSIENQWKMFGKWIAEVGRMLLSTDLLKAALVGLKWLLGILSGLILSISWIFGGLARQIVMVTEGFIALYDAIASFSFSKAKDRLQQYLTDTKLMWKDYADEVTKQAERISGIEEKNREIAIKGEEEWNKQVKEVLKKRNEAIKKAFEEGRLTKEKYPDLYKMIFLEKVKLPVPEIEETGADKSRSIISSLRGIMSKRLALMKVEEDEAFHILENARKRREISDQEYYEKRKKLVLKYLKIEIDDLEDNYKKIFALYDIAIKTETKLSEKKALIEAKKKEKEDYELRKETLFSKKRMLLDDDVTENKTKNLKIQEERQKVTYGTYLVNLETQRSRESFNIDQEQKRNEWLYSTKQKNIDDYLKEEKRLIEENQEDKLSFLEEEKGAFHWHQFKRLRLVKGQIVEEDKIREETKKKEEQFAQEKVRIDQEATDKLLENARKVKDAREIKLGNYIAAMEGIKGYEKEVYEYKLELLEILADKIKTDTGNAAAAEKWLLEERRKAYRDYVLAAGTAFGGIKVGFDEIIAKSISWGNGLYGITLQTAELMQNAFSDVFFDGISGKMKTFQDYWFSFTNSLLRAFTNMLAEMFVEWLALQAKMVVAPLVKSGMEWVGLGLGLLGGGGGGGPRMPGGGVLGGSTTPILAHSGGIIGTDFFPTRNVPDWLFSFAPKLHKGLTTDEYPAILQKGERVFSRSQNKEYEKNKGAIIINVPITIDSQNKKMISDLRNEIEDTTKRIIRRYN